MATQADIPSDLTDNDKAYMFQYLDAELNSTILFTLLHGMYTGILAVTLWNIFINKCWPIRRALVVIIILLYILIAVSVSTSWSYVHCAFVENGKSFWTVYLRFGSPGQPVDLMDGVAGIVGTILTDLYMIWCCWMVWGQQWLIVLLPILFLISATVLKIIEIFYEYITVVNFPIFRTLYISFVLATTLWCTLLMIYRILTVVGVRHGTGGRLRVYHRFIEVLVESSALYSISLIVYLPFAIRDDFGAAYLDAIAAIAKGVAPTLLIGRAAAGHTRPNDEGDGSTVSSLHFQAPSEAGTTSFQESTVESTVWEVDIEAQQQQSNELTVVVEGA